ncbi:MAG: hypothetical protein HW400_463 [Candidatus Levybacteria bacterium]|nr:hypothetical protein [Candidatus Levybacteria bacterium]
MAETGTGEGIGKETPEEREMRNLGIGKAGNWSEVGNAFREFFHLGAKKPNVEAKPTAITPPVKAPETPVNK